MKNNIVIKIAIMLIALLIVNSITFLLISTYEASRIINIIFLNLSIIVLGLFAFLNTKDKQNKFLNYSKLPIVTLYSIITFIMSIILILINPKKIVVTIVLQILVTGIFTIIMLINKMADNSTENSVNEMKSKITDTKVFSNQLNTIMQGIKDRNLYRKIEKVYDASRSLKINIQSDPIEIDKEISSYINLLEIKVNENSIPEIDEIIENINRCFVKRNNY